MGPRDFEAASQELINPRDILTTSQMGSLAQHKISFCLPQLSPGIKSSQFLIVDLPYFSYPSPPTYLAGNYSGSPVFETDRTTVTITNISMESGSCLTINGITAYNPNTIGRFNVYLYVSDNDDASDPIYESHIVASPGDESVTVTANVDAYAGRLQISGKAAPGMFLTFNDNGSTIGTTTANSTGLFDQMFSNLSPGLHGIEVVGMDLLGRTTPATIVEVYIQAYTLTNASNIIIPPTVSVSETEISEGDSITVAGSGIPGYSVILFTEPPLNSYESTVDPDGSFSYVVSGENFSLGQNKAYALLQDDSGTQTRLSASAYFNVVSGSGATLPSPNEAIAKGDLNTDGTVDIYDFSILLFYWGSTDPAGDINSDGRVDLYDFSIMMFYWNITF